MVEEICNSLIKNGFKRLFFVNSHVGNDATIWATANNLSVKGLARVGMVSIWSLSTEIGKDIEALEEKCFLHAGEIMTSVVMAIRPDLVDMKAAATEYLKPLTDGYQAVLSGKSRVNGKLVSFYHTSNELTKSGVMGNPLAASSEKGELILGKLVEQTSKTINEFRKLPIPKGV
jgi:creatinine amidohydrolase